MPDPHTRLVFKIGEAFPADDLVAVFVMRLSMALNDIRTAIDYAVRDEQPDHERIYFVRLATFHLREIVKIVDPQPLAAQRPPCESCGKPEPRPEFSLPDLDALIAATEIPRTEADALRRARQDVVDALDVRLALRPVKLRQELRRLRNTFAHYHADVDSHAALTDAMTRAARYDGTYEIGDGDLRARYADDVIANLTHPFGDDDPETDVMARELHGHIAGLIQPLGRYLQLAEATYLSTRAPGVVQCVPVGRG